jgi:hypothetical protein
MLNLFRRTWLRVTTRHAATDRRTRRFGVSFESLESRNMLSASPLAVEYYAVIGSISDVSLVGSVAAGIDADDGEEYERQNGSWVSVGGGEMDRRDLDVIRTLKPDYETWLPNLPPTKGGLGGEYGIPPIVRDPPTAMPGTSPPGGLIDLTELGHTTPQTSPAPMFETRADREAREVQAMLSTLKFVPDNSQAKNDGATAPTVPHRTPPTQPGASRDQTFLDSPQGGMITLAREVVIRQSEGAKKNLSVDVESSLNVRVQMDSARGKFQAFEISNAEENPPAVPPPSIPPAASGARAVPSMNVSPELTTGAVFVSIPAPRAVADAAEGDFPIVAKSTDEALEPAGPVAREEPANASWSAAAAAFLLALAARAAWPAAVRKPDDDAAPASYARPERRTTSRIRTLGFGQEPIETIRIE